jgi:hypothetical protein
MGQPPTEESKCDNLKASTKQQRFKDLGINLAMKPLNTTFSEDYEDCKMCNNAVANFHLPLLSMLLVLLILARNSAQRLRRNPGSRK